LVEASTALLRSSPVEVEQRAECHEAQQHSDHCQERSQQQHLCAVGDRDTQAERDKKQRNEEVAQVGDFDRDLVVIGE